jgi:hypothetical protein
MAIVSGAFDRYREGTEEARERATRAGEAPRHRANRVHPATSEQGYTAAEWEFIKAIDSYKRASGTPFPSWVEVYGVFKGLGYSKRSATEARQDDGVPA